MIDSSGTSSGYEEEWREIGLGVLFLSPDYISESFFATASVPDFRLASLPFSELPQSIPRWVCSPNQESPCDSLSSSFPFYL